jgi:hypothetical protein
MGDSLESLVPGDAVIIRQHLRPSEVATVDRLTKLHIVVKLPNYAGTLYDNKFRRDNGRKVGDTDSWSPRYLEVGTPERVAEVKEKRAREVAIERIRKDPLINLTTARLLAIVAILDEKDTP